MEGIVKKIWAVAVLFSVTLPLLAEELDQNELAFFETNIRPLLMDNCYKCHSADAKKIKGGFLLDSKPGLLRGGDSGQAIIPGDVDNSRLIHMVSHDPDFESMPPKSKLSKEEIGHLETWIEMGAPDPRLEETERQLDESDFDLEKRKQWWSLQPVEKYKPPKVKNESWPSNDYDRFILADLEEKAWVPAEPADRHTLLRRLSFDLIGLAPTPEELDKFINDRSRNAYANQVDRLLASPHFGEKWARHWMDLTRYAETKSFEQDYTMPYTWRYRDYLIQAFNEDVPYDQFILESLAGDLLKNARVNPGTGDNESAKGPGFIYLSDGQHGPPDLHEDEARVFDRMIDTVSKAFLGSTIACARCHDHKFDAITTADYYSLYGILRSSRFTHHNTVSERVQKSLRNKLRSKKRSLRSLVLDAAKPDVDNAQKYLTSANSIIEQAELNASISSLNSKYPENKRDKNATGYLEALHEILAHYCEEAASNKLEPEVLENWLMLLLLPEVQKRWPELTALHNLKDDPKPKEETSQSFESITHSLDKWTKQGLAFQDQPRKPGTIILKGEGNNAVQAIIGDTIIGGQFTARITGAIRSPDFIIDGKLIELEAKGNYGAVRLVVRNYELTGRGPTTAKLYVPVNSDYWQTIRMETYLWEGQPAYLEVLQYGEATHSITPKEEEPESNENAYLTIRFDGGLDQKLWLKKKFGDSSAETFLALLPQIWKRGRQNRLNAQESELLSAFFGAGLISANTSRDKNLDKALTSYRKLSREIPSPRLARSLVDGDPKDEPVYIRGLHKNLSQDPNPRHWLDGLGGPELKSNGSGRLEWAIYVADPGNPLTSRVIVNRLWKHIFGTGLVATVNDFGKMGRQPTHPELLDYLAQDFIRNDWSIKSTIRKLVLSSTYQQSSTPSELSLEEDPANKLLQHMPVKRLEAEAIRDHILACSGELDTTLFGPSVQAYVGDLPESRAIPESGPLDGNGRRSVYLEIRRSFLPSFLRAFDLPNATEPIGARQVTNVPAQSLALMNDPFVHQQAAAWAKRILETRQSTTERIQQLHLTAYGRPANDKELIWAQSFITSMAVEYQTREDDPKVWTDLCHLMYNRKDFIYLF